MTNDTTRSPFDYPPLMQALARREAAAREQALVAEVAYHAALQCPFPIRVFRNDHYQTVVRIGGFGGPMVAVDDADLVRWGRIAGPAMLGALVGNAYAELDVPVPDNVVLGSE